MKSKFKIFICLFAYLLICLFPTNAFAESTSLGVSPPILQIEAIPPAEIRAPFVVENLGDEAVDLQIGYKLFKNSDQENGQIEYLLDTDPFPGANPRIFDQIEIVDEDNFSIDSLSLGPKQKANLILRIIAPKKEPFSDYYFSLIFLNQTQQTNLSSDSRTKDSEDKEAPLLVPQEQKEEKGSGSSPRIGIAMTVLLSIGPKTQAKGSIEEFSTPWYREFGPVPFTIKVKNNASQYITPKGSITIKNMFNQAVGRVELEESNILAGSSRYLISRNQENKVVWSEKFLLGFYTARLDLSLSDQGPVFTRSIHFVALPVKLFLGIAIVIIIILLAYFRIKRTLKE